MNFRKWVMNRIAVPVLRRLPLARATDYVEAIGRWEFDRLPGLREHIIHAVSEARTRLNVDWDTKATARNLSGRLTRWRLRDILLDGPDAELALNSFEIVGLEHFEQARAQGRGVILLSNHFGGHMLPAHWMLRHGIDFRFLTERPRHVSRALDDYFRSTGPVGQQELFISRKRSGNDGVSSLMRSLRILKSQYVLLLASDVRWANNLSVTARFLGERWKFTPIWAVLSQRSNAPVVSVYCSMLPEGKHRIEFAPPLNIAPDANLDEIVQNELSRLESRVLADPENANDYFFWALDQTDYARELRVLDDPEPKAASETIRGPHFDVDSHAATNLVRHSD
jgi:KDO2-lipid IV(A) lauroyltransferase